LPPRGGEVEDRSSGWDRARHDGLTRLILEARPSRIAGTTRCRRLGDDQRLGGEPPLHVDAGSQLVLDVETERASGSRAASPAAARRRGERRARRPTELVDEHAHDPVRVEVHSEFMISSPAGHDHGAGARARAHRSRSCVARRDGLTVSPTAAWAGIPISS
jgi:hypothetical protein